MPTSEARIRANQANAARATGPRTVEGKARSRANALKHGMTGEGVVQPEEDADEVERLSRAFADELKAEGEVGHTLARRMAVMAVRMDRCGDQERAALSERVRQALDEFEPPEGAGPEEAERLRSEAGDRAMFDPSKEACLARKYEAAAERCFFRALKELRQLEKQKAPSPAADLAAEAQVSMARLGSFLAAGVPAAPKPSPAPSKSTPNAWDPFPETHFDVPIAIGRAR